MAARTSKAKAENGAANKAEVNGPTGLIKGTAPLLQAITNVHRAGKKYHDQLHIVAVSAMYHAAEHGNPEPLNKFSEGLSKSYQSAFKAWLGRLAGKSPAPLGVGVDKAWLDLQAGKFVVIPDRMGPRMKDDDAFGKRVDAVMKGKPFYENNLDRGIGNVFGAEQVLGRLEGLEKAIEKAISEEKDEDKRMNPQLLALIKQARMQAEALVPANPGINQIQ